MNEYITALDVETTGLNPKEDFIIQLSAVKFDRTNPSNIIKEFNYYIKPIHKYEITQSATEVNGLTKEFIDANGVDLSKVAIEFVNMIKDSDILTYNGNRFDIKFLVKDFELIGINLPLENKQFYDSFGMECRFNPRDLSTTYKKYTGKELENAHDALADVKATISVFENQIKQYNLTEEDLNGFEENNLLSPEGSIRYANPTKDEEKIIVFAVGKYKDSEFMSILKNDPSYIKWYMENVATEYTKRILREYYIKNKDK